jgi:hypothetical protein
MQDILVKVVRWASNSRQPYRFDARDVDPIV